MNQMFIDVSGGMYVENSEHEPKILTEFREGKMIFLWWRDEGSLASSCWILPISQRGMEPWVLACGLRPGIGERGLGVGLDGQCSIFVHSWVFLSGLGASPCRAGYSEKGEQEE